MIPRDAVYRLLDARGCYRLIDGEVERVSPEEFLQFQAQLADGKETLDGNVTLFATDISHEPNYPDGHVVSTVFLGTDHSFELHRAEHVPILFETMIFGGPFDLNQRRYATLDEAKAGHAAMVQRVQEYHQ